MGDILKSYAQLSSTTPRSQVSHVLQSIITALPFSFDHSSRSQILTLLLHDLKSIGPKAKLSHKDAAQALLAVKTLGRIPGGSDPLAEPTSLSTLLGLASSLKDDPEASTEALRCIANTLLLFEHARETLVSKEVGGCEICLAMLDKATAPDQVFTLSRIFFLVTVSRTPLIPSLDRHRHHRCKLDTSMVTILAGTKFARDAMTDLLKFAFNILLHYPKMIDNEAPADATEEWNDAWSPKLDGYASPASLTHLPHPPAHLPRPMVAPLTHIVHALITIPITPSSRPVWFNTAPPSLARTSTSSRASSSRAASTSTTNTNSPGTSSPVLSPLSPSDSPDSPKPSTLDRAAYDVLQRTHDLLEVAFSHHFPGNSDPDSEDVRNAFTKEIAASGAPADTSLDDVLSPLVVLCTRLCLADEDSRVRMRAWMVPADLDRTNPLDERKDFLGGVAVGEMLYAACDSDGGLFGYGHVAGHLFSKGDREINPITGTYAPVGSTRSATADMTEEEKEQEMEKLFVLFDRLEKSGAMPASQNPMRKVIEKSMAS
ncbi:guanine nucleotide exchange factor synembryn-domain-containing protein [Rhodocollybia butyracea]|uniref:Guanine nucleotide exchange factor synembryn-domain-containing protein n=1 Tax=Rhodocollybia butyracea TaxID=206335 RepID=A0A9P5QAI2_9AGAR|nr:guanine nucleotide exchange factor synembryn-domain-containing protein [Rhodocollybia butyracea]